MATASAVAAALVAAIAGDLPEIDQTSNSGFLPMITTRSVALVATSLGQQDEGRVYSAGWMHVIHNLKLRFFVKHVNGQEDTTVQRARDVGYRAMQALVRHDGAGYTLAAGDFAPMSSQVNESFVEEAGQPYMMVTLSVACWQKESV